MPKLIPLSSAALTRLDPQVAVPGYDRDQAQVGIVHFGVGAFHRAHQAAYLDDVISGGASTWGICGVGVLPHDRAIADVLRAQDGLYTLLTVDPTGTTTARVIGSHLLHLHAPDDPYAVLNILIDPATRIVSLTITEGGYSINDATGAFDPHDAQTLADLAHPTGVDSPAGGAGRANLTGVESSAAAAPPSSVLGFVVTALAARRAAGTDPFSIVSCDNIQGNGHVARAAVTGFAERVDPDLAAWIGRYAAFPSSMVDRITPATTATVSAAAANYGIDDGWPVRSEAFTQWVLEDTFSAGRPPLETVGVQLVADVAPYELMKLRLLNASHQVMSYLGLLAGYTYVHDVCRDPDFTPFLLDYMHHEAIPTLDPVPGINLDDYCTQLIERFSSDAILDTLARQTADGSDRIPKFVLPVIRAQLAAGGDIARATLALAAWSLYLDDTIAAHASTPSTGGAGDATVPVDRRLDALRAAAAAERAQPGAFLDQPDVFGDLARDPVLRAAFTGARAQLIDVGARAAVIALTREETLR